MVENFFRRYKAACTLIFGLFFLWGIARSLYDTLVSQFAAAFRLESGEMLLIVCVYSLFYFLFAVPAAIYARSFGSKAGVVFGLGCWSVGAFLFYPAAQAHVLFFFLVAAAVMSCGYIFVEICANPIIVRLGSPARAPMRLNFAHALWPAGVLAALAFERWFDLTDLAVSIDRVGIRPYMLIGLAGLLLAFVMDNARFPAFATERGKVNEAVREFRELLSRPMMLAAIGAQFFSVAAIAGIWTFSSGYIVQAMPTAAPVMAGVVLMVPLLLFAAGRLLGAFLMLRFNPEVVLAGFALWAMVLCAVCALSGGSTGVYALVAASFCMSVMFPTILGLAVRGLGPLTKAGTALVYIGGSGSGIGIGAMYLVSSASSVAAAMLVPALCCAGVLAFALASRTAVARQSAPVAQPAE